nr:hypothetical protein [Neorhizobium tomejilense]
MAIVVKRASAPQAEPGFFVAYDDLGVENRFVVSAGGEDNPAKGGVKLRTLLRQSTRFAKS